MAVVQQRDLVSHCDRRGRCLFVGKGPSAMLAEDHLHFGDVATVNNAGLLLPYVDWSFWCDVPPEWMIEPIRDRCRTFVVPDSLHCGQFDLLRWKWPKRSISEVSCFPTGRTMVYKYNHISFRAVREAILADEIPMASTATAGLYILARYLGYSEIWCFGHDGGHGVAPPFKDAPGGPRFGNYSRFRKALEAVADCIADRIGTVVRFWPDMDETWRSPCQ